MKLLKNDLMKYTTIVQYIPIQKQSTETTLNSV